MRVQTRIKQLSKRVTSQSFGNLFIMLRHCHVGKNIEAGKKIAFVLTEELRSIFGISKNRMKPCKGIWDSYFDH
jgi:hypothetical protein